MNPDAIAATRELIEAHPDIVDFGSADDAVDDEWIAKAERRLGVRLPASYLWFLKNYAGGEIGGEEVFSLYGMEFEEVSGGDIVYQHLINLKENLTSAERIVVMETDFGESFFFDYANFDGEDCPVSRRLPTTEPEIYAADFCEFLQKRIRVFADT